MHFHSSVMSCLYCSSLLFVKDCLTNTSAFFDFFIRSMSSDWVQSFTLGTASKGWFPGTHASLPPDLIWAGTTVLVTGEVPSAGEGFLTLQPGSKLMVEKVGHGNEEGLLYGFDLGDVTLLADTFLRGWFPKSAVSPFNKISTGATVEARFPFEAPNNSGYLTFAAGERILVQFVGRREVPSEEGWIYGLDLRSCFCGAIPVTPRPVIQPPQPPTWNLQTGRVSGEFAPFSGAGFKLSCENPPQEPAALSANSVTEVSAPVLANTHALQDLQQGQLVLWPQVATFRSRGQSLPPTLHLPTLQWTQGELATWMSGFDSECMRADHSFFELNPYTDVYDFLRKRLIWNANRCGKSKYGFKCMLDPPGPSANLQPDHGLLEAAVFSKGESSSESQTPRMEWEPESSWWPVVVRLVPGWNSVANRLDMALVPFYCPSLAANGARPWYVHVSRVWLVSRL